MIGIGGRFAAAKGMVAVPNLIGLSRAAAQSAIEAAGLVYGGYSDNNVADSGLDDKIASQSILANTLVDYETSVSLIRYKYEVPSVPPSYPPKPSDDGQIIPGSCNITSKVRSGTPQCDGTTLVTPQFIIYERVDTKKVYVEGPGYTWTLTYVNEPAVTCLEVPTDSIRELNNSTCVSCGTVVSQNFYSGANSNCASGFSNYRTDVYGTGCVPKDKTFALGCITDPNPPEVVLEYTLFGDCTQVTGTSSSETSTGGIPCLFDGGGIRTRTRHYSNNTDVVDTICCSYTPPAPTCTPSTSYGAYSSCNATGLNPGTQSRTVTTTFDDCSVTTITESVQCCIAYCEPFTSWSPSCAGMSPGTEQTRSATCVSSINCNQYTKTETQCCTGVVVSYGPCTGTTTKRRSKSTTTYYSNCTSSTSTTSEVCNLFE